MGYKRWYDQDAKFGEVVRAMEFMTMESREKFAVKLLELSEELMERHGDREQYLEALEAEKKYALEKADINRRRWYDQIEELHLAFNNLYAMTPAGRREIARRFVTPIMLVGAYENHCRKEGREPVMRIVQEILWTSLLENGGEKRARRLYSIYLYDSSTYNAAPAGPGPAPQPDGSGFWSTLLTSLQSALAA